MPAQILFGSVKDKIPLERTPLNLNSLTSINVVGKYAFLKIKSRHKHHVCRINRLKMLLEDREGHVMDFFALGQVADDLQVCEEGDMLLCLEFELEECPGHCQRCYQIIADDTGTRKSFIWVSKPLNSPTSSSAISDARNPQMQVEKGSDGRDKRKKGQSYNYQALSEMKVNTVVDVYGVVKFVKPPIKGKGSDFFCVIGIIDPSLFEEEEKLTCIFFHRESDNLPKVEEGDVIRLHRLKIQAYQGGKQAQNGPGFQWLAFHGSIDNRTSSSTSYTFEDQDKKKVDNLLKWWSKQCQNEMALLETPKKNLSSLASVKPKEYFDLVCQVVRVCLLEPDICRLIRVWDGTKSEMQLKEITEGELNQSLKEDCLLVKASAGLFVDIFLFDNHARESSHVKPGDYLLLTNVHSAVVSGLVELTIHGAGHQFRRGIQVLPVDSKTAQILKAKLNHISDKIAVNLNNCSMKTTSASQSGQRISCSKTDDSQKEVSKLGGDSQGFHLSDFSKDDLESDTPKLRERKDVSSKNKSLRRKMLFQESSILGDVMHQQESDVLLNDLNTTDDIDHEDKRNDSSEGSCQSIWLSIYNDSDNEQNISETAYPSDLRQGHSTSKAECFSPISSKKKMDYCNKATNQTNSNICHGGNPMREKSSAQDKKNDQQNVMQEVNSEDGGSSHESFVTITSKGESLPLRSEINQDSPVKARETLLASCADNQRQTDKRAGETMGNPNEKRLKLSPERRKKGYESGFPQTFSQIHLEVLDSEVLCFDTNEFSQTTHAKGGIDETKETDSLIKETELHLQEYGDSHKSPSQSREKHNETVVQKSSCLTKNVSEGTESTETKSTHNSKILEMSERSQVCQDSQDFLQAGTVDSQVSSSTDSLKVSSQPRCMLKTASVILNHPDVPLSTLQEVLDHRPPHKFRIQARVERIEPRPSVPQDLVHFLCPRCKFFSRMESRDNNLVVVYDENMNCPRCVEPPSTLRPVSVIVLQLSDQQNSISASVWDKNADHFFGGVSPYQLLNDSSCFHQVQEWLNNLCPLGSKMESRPLLECCVCSYYVDGDIKIQIFDTSLV